MANSCGVRKIKHPWNMLKERTYCNIHVKHAVRRRHGANSSSALHHESSHHHVNDNFSITSRPKIFYSLINVLNLAKYMQNIYNMFLQVLSIPTAAKFNSCNDHDLCYFTFILICNLTPSMTCSSLPA